MFAAKVMRNYDAEKEMSSKAEYNLMKEIKPHPNITSVEEFIATENWTYTIMELAEGLELQDYIFKNSEKMTISIIKDMTKQLLQAILHLHDQHIVHKDIKPENIMVNQISEDLVNIKLIDFNVSQVVKDD